MRWLRGGGGERSGYTHFRNSLWFTSASVIWLCSFSAGVNFPFCFPLSFYSQYPFSLFSFFLCSVPFDFLSLCPPLSEVRNPILSDFLCIHLKCCSHCAPHILLLSPHHVTCKSCGAVTNNVPEINYDISESNVYWTVHHCNSWGMKNKLDVTCYLISLMRSTCFGH